VLKGSLAHRGKHSDGRSLDDLCCAHGFLVMVLNAFEQEALDAETSIGRPA